MNSGIAGQGRFVGLLGTLFALLLASSGARVSTAQNAPSAPHRGFRVSTKVDAGLSVVTFRTPQGTITLNLPADLRVGDSIVGSVGWQAKGDNDSARNANQMTLATYTLGLGDQTKLLSEQTPYWKAVVPAEEKARWIVLKDAQGVEVAHVMLPFPATAPPVQPGEANHIGASRVPSKGQAGRPLALPGGSSGNATNMHVWIGAKEASLLAASPRTIIIMTPKDFLGKTQLRMKQGDLIVYEGDYRNERVRRDNPWPWIIVGVIVAVVIIGVEAAASLNHSLHNLGNGNPINLE